MRFLSLWTFLAAILLASCASHREAVDADLGTESRERVAEVGPRSSEHSERTPSVVADRGSFEAASAHRLVDWEAMRNDVEFQRRFKESYLAETDIEPRLSGVEREELVAVFGEINAGHPEKALDILGGLTTDQSSAVFDFIRGNVLMELERADDAEAAYMRATVKFPRFRRAWRMLGEIRIRKGQFRAAQRALTQVVALGGTDGATYGMLGIACANQELYIPAESAFRNAALLQPESMNWKLGLAKSFFGQQRYADAVALFHQLLKDSPDRADFWLTQGQAYAMLGKLEEAARDFEIVDAMGKSTSKSLFDLGDIYSNKKIYSAAVDAYLRGMSKGGAHSPDRILRAAKFLSRNNAIEETNHLLDGFETTFGSQLSEDERKQVLRLRAHVALVEGNDDKQADYLEKVIDLDPLDGRSLILLGQYADRKGNTDRAIEFFERAERLEEFEAEAKLRHGEVLVRRGEYGPALRLLESAQAITPRENVQEFIDRVQRASKRGSR